MKKRIVLLTGVGIGAGLLYVFKAGRRSSATEPDSVASTRNDGTENASHFGNGQSLWAERELNETRRSSMGKIAEGHGTHVDGDETDGNQPLIDDRGTDQHEAAEILKTVRDGAFDASDEKLALALGRPAEEIEAWTSGSGDVAGDIDGDVVMKARALALTRGVEI